jgi:hypothetical protein
MCGVSFSMVRAWSLIGGSLSRMVTANARAPTIPPAGGQAKPDAL